MTSVVSVVSGPKLGSEDGNSICGVSDNRPCVVGLVARDGVEEVMVVDGLVTSNQGFLILLLDVSEVGPVAEGVRILYGETAEGLVHLDLLERGVLQGTTGDSATRVVYLGDGAGKSIELSKVLRGEDDASCGVDNFGGVRGLDQDGVEFTSEESAEVAEFLLVALGHVWHAGEDKV